jgi:hypothetical protein
MSGSGPRLTAYVVQQRPRTASFAAPPPTTSTSIPPVPPLADLISLLDELKDERNALDERNAKVLHDAETVRALRPKPKVTPKAPPDSTSSLPSASHLASQPSALPIASTSHATLPSAPPKPPPKPLNGEWTGLFVYLELVSPSSALDML